MSADREEIRWKFQVILESMNQLLELLENERKEFQENLYKSAIELKEIRNNWLAGIGFGIGILVSLIAIGVLGKENVWYIIIGMIAGISIFIGYNLYLTRKYHKYAVIGRKYLQIGTDFLNLKGVIAGISLNEAISHQYVILLTNFVYVIGQAFVYELQYYGYNTIQTIKPNQDDFRDAYKMAKENIVEFQKMSLDKYAKRIELFISVFEKNDKLSTTN